MKHDFFENSLKGLLKSLNTKLIPFGDYNDQAFPIMVKSTGDETYLHNMYKDDIKQYYDKVPRMTLSVGGLSVISDQLTRPHNYGKLIDIDKTTGMKQGKATYFRRIPITLTMGVKVVFENIIQQLAFIEIVLSTRFRTTTFSFSHAGYTCVGVYELPTDFEPDINYGLGNDHETRNIEMPFTFELQLQMPSYDYYEASNLLDSSNTIQEIIHNTHSPEQIDTLYVPKRDTEC